MPHYHRLFLDTGFIQGVYYPHDQYYQLCYQHIDYIERAQEVYTTNLVLMEILDAFSQKRRRVKGLRIVRTLLAQPQINVIHLSNRNFRESLELYGTMEDKNWGGTDCFSILVMRELNLTACLTTDKHFQQAGFEILPFRG